MQESKRLQKGMALVFTLFVLVIVSVIGLGIVTVLMSGSKGSFGYLNNTKALYCARAGVSRAIAQLEANPLWTTKTENLGNGSYTVTATPDPNNGTRPLKQWSISSQGSSGGATRTLTVFLQQGSFAAYAYFTDKEQAPGGGTIWFIGQDQLTGDVHTNGYFSMLQHPQFSSKVTSSQGVVDGPVDAFYTQATATYSQGPGAGPYTNPAYFYHDNSSYATDGPVALSSSPSFTFAGGQPNVPMPANLNSISSSASQTLTGNCTMVFQNTAHVVVTGCAPAGTYSTAGATFWVTGSAYISGTFSGNATVGSAQDIHVTNSVVYNDKTKDILGLAATNNVYVDTASSGNFEIDASIMALNTSFSVVGYNAGAPRGTLTVFGGIIQTDRGPVGQGTLSGGVLTMTHGYAKNYVYDNVLMNTPPPNFPTTGLIVVKEWLDSNALGH